MKTPVHRFGLLCVAALLGLAAPTSAAPGDVDSLDLQMVYTGFNSGVDTGLPQLDGKLILTGSFDQVLGMSRKNVVRINTNGTLDTSFPFQASEGARSVAIQADGKVVLTGSSFFYNLGSFIGRINADNTPDTAFAPHPNDSVECIAVQPDGKLVIGGRFTTLQPPGAPSPITRNHIARLNPDGTLDLSFNPDANGWVFSVAVQPDGRILLGGQFTTIRGQPRTWIARISAEGTLDSTVFAPSTGYPILSLVLQPDGKILVGGAPNLVRPGFARLNANGTLDASFDPKPDGGVISIALQADGRILIGGDFTTFQPNGAPAAITRKYIARLGRLIPSPTPRSTPVPPAALSMVSACRQMGRCWSLEHSQPRECTLPDSSMILPRRPSSNRITHESSGFAAAPRRK